MSSLRRTEFRLLFSAIAVVLAVILVAALPLSAQDTWAPPRLIPYYEAIYAPHLVADENRTVHAFNAEENGEGNERVIMYRQWTLEGGWTQPIDIFYRAGTGILEVVDVLLDEKSIVHLVFYDGNPPARGDLYYTTAPLAEVGKTTAWSTPVLIGQNAGPVVFGSLAGDKQGKLVVVYSGVEEGFGLYETHTTDSGKTWSDSTPFTFAYGDDVLLGRMQTIMDDQGRVHAVWSEMNGAGLGQAVYYSHSDLDQNQWSSPVVLAQREGNDYAADWPSIAKYKDELMVIYYDGSIPNGVPPTRWMRQSRDSGQTWTEPVQPFPHVGENGFPVLLTDSNQALHIVLANRVGNPIVGGSWHGVWLGDRWSELEPIAVRPEGLPSATPSVEDDTAVGASSRPSAVISQGNVLLVAWWHDMSDPPSAGFSFRTLNAPELPLIVLPTSVPPTPIPTPTPRIIPPTPMPLTEPPLESIVISDTADKPSKEADTTQVLVAGLGSSLALLAVAALVIVRRRKAP